MLTSDLKPVAVLNQLVVINNDRLEGYNMATTQTDSSVLRALFSRLTETSLICRQELVNEVYKLGGIPRGESLASGDFFRAWTYVREALTARDPRLILNSCFYEEDVAVRSYEEALAVEDESITTQHQALFIRQHEMLLADHSKVKNLMNALLKE